VPPLAPHFGVGIMGQNNKETQAVPIIGLESTKGASDRELGPEGCFARSQPPRLVELVAKELGVDDYGEILGWDLELYDSQPATTGGLDRDLIFAGRIDDKLCSWSALVGLLHADDAETDDGVKLVALFDNEEIGSLLRQGARGNFLPGTVQRLVEALCGGAEGGSSAAAASSSSATASNLLGQTYARSFLLSADVIHAVNPNFSHLYLADHQPRLNVGITLSSDSNGHMSTDGVSGSIVRRVGELGGGAVQNFQIRNDSRSGGTVGPMLSSAMGVRAADAGLPQLSMHSIRATTGALDPGLGVRYFKAFLDKWAEIDAEWEK
jgi:aminopeptidase I